MQPPKTFNLVSFVTENAASLPSEPHAARRTRTASTGATVSASPAPDASYATLDASTDDAERVFRAARYLSSIEPAIVGDGGCHDQTFDAACALVKGYDLRPELARPILEKWNERCVPPWESRDIEHKLRDADERPDDKPRGYLFDAKKPTEASVPAVTGQPNAVPAPNPPAPVPPDPEGSVVAPGREDNPHRLANTFLRAHHNHDEGYTIRFWQDEFHMWVNGSYLPIRDKEIRAELTNFTYLDFEKVYVTQLIAAGSNPDPNKPVKPIPVTTALTGNVFQAMTGATLLQKAKYPSQPCWLDGDDGWPVAEVLPMQNAVVHIPSHIAGEPCTRKPTPRLFTPYVLDYEWNATAPEPVRWLEFLGARPIASGSPIKHQLWRDDQQSIDTLQEWFGLQLVPVTRFQKMLALLGPPRCGKGTIAHVMSHMVGQKNCAGPTLTGISGEFGMEPLIGKLAAIIDDVRLGPKSDHAVITERLLSISGQGYLTVNRKNKTFWTGVLASRITMLSNELPRLNDNSNALTNRFIILRLTESLVGMEDDSLRDLFLTELPGILLWAIEGWRRLVERGRLVQPQSGQDDHDDMADMSSPIGAFAKECCNIGPDESSTKDNLFLAWRQWCERNNKKEVGELAVFSRNLRSVVPGLKTPRPKQGSQRVRMFQGVGLRLPSEMFGEAPEQGSEQGALGGVGEDEQAGYTDEQGIPF